MIEVHMFPIVAIQASRRIQSISLMAKQSFTEERVDLEIWGSLGSRQLLQLQHFPKIQNFLGPSFYFFLLSSLVLFDVCTRITFMPAMFYGLY